MGGAAPYTTLNVGDAAVGGFMRRDPEQHPDVPNSWTVYFATDDIDATATQINENGGRVLNGPFPTPVGPMLIAADPQGAVFQAIEMAPAQSDDA